MLLILDLFLKVCIQSLSTRFMEKFIKYVSASLQYRLCQIRCQSTQMNTIFHKKTYTPLCSALLWFGSIHVRGKSTWTIYWYSRGLYHRNSGNQIIVLLPCNWTHCGLVTQWERHQQHQGGWYLKYAVGILIKKTIVILQVDNYPICGNKIQ